MPPPLITPARAATARQETEDVLCAAQALIHMTRYDHNLRRFARAQEIERECQTVLDFLELLARMEPAR